jgi:cellulose synthase/poly-beta-1,6-N-acetylglucosamine synthase-like glycosyltransferase
MEAVIFDVARAIIMFFVVITLFKNYMFLVLSPFYPLREKWRRIKATLARREASLPRYNPKVSVIIPAWNEGVGVIKTIESVLSNGYDNVQVVVVNDGSTDDSDKTIRAFIDDVVKTTPRLAEKITYKYNKHGGKGVALNAGIKLAKGDIIMTVDADSALKRGSIQNLTKYYLDEEIMAVVGNVEVVNAHTLVGLAQQMEYFFGFYNKRAHALLGAEYIFGGACASFRKQVFEQIGLFDTENKTEDIEMSMRTKFYGMKSTYAEDVVCYTEGASDLKGLISQRIRWKKGRFDTFRKYRSMFFSAEDHHNLFLAFFVLPFSLLTEINLMFEPIAIAIMIAYVIITSEYLSLALGISYIVLVFVAVPLFHSHPRPKYVFYFPFWPLFYFLDWIEFLSLYKSLKMIRRGQQVEWQKWNRQGISNHLKKENGRVQ